MKVFSQPGIGVLVRTALFTALGAVAHAEPAHKLVALGNEAFREGEFEKALALYDEASVELPESASVYFNRGAVLYKQENYEKASEAFRDAALRSKERVLSSRAKFNRGNCAFREAERQRDSDLKKAIEHCQESISFYGEAHDLDPGYHQAAENIEIVRLFMKVLLDEQKKRQEDQEQQDQQEENLVTKLKKLIERQQTLLARNSELEKQKPEESDSAAEQQWKDSLGELVTGQKTLADDSGAVLEEIEQTRSQAEQAAAAAAQKQDPAQNQDPNQPTPEQIAGSVQKLGEAAGHVNHAVTNEQAAAAQLAATVQSSAARNQESAVRNLEEAVKALSDDNQQQQQQGNDPQDQEGDQKEQEEEQEEEEGESDPKEQGEQEEEQKEGDEQENQPRQGEDEQESEEQREARARLEKADDILDEEKENQKQRRPVRPGRVLPVDRDW